MIRISQTFLHDRPGDAPQSALGRTLGVLDLAPLANIVLLLVIFALVINGIVFQPGLKLNLPVIVAPSIIQGRVLTLTVTPEQRVYVDDPARPAAEQARPVGLKEALVSVISEFGRRHPEGTVLIKADVNVRHGYLLELMEMIRDAGIRQIAFGSMPQAGPEAAAPAAR